MWRDQLRAFRLAPPAWRDDEEVLASADRVPLVGEVRFRGRSRLEPAVQNQIELQIMKSKRLSQEPSKAVACTAAHRARYSRGAGDKWQTKGERCALAYARALRSDRAAVQLHELLHDRQAESQS